MARRAVVMVFIEINELAAEVRFGVVDPKVHVLPELDLDVQESRRTLGFLKLKLFQNFVIAIERQFQSIVASSRVLVRPTVHSASNFQGAGMQLFLQTSSELPRWHEPYIRPQRAKRYNRLFIDHRKIQMVRYVRARA